MRKPNTEMKFTMLVFFIRLPAISDIMSPIKTPIIPPRKTVAPPARPVLSVIVKEAMKAPAIIVIMIKKILKNAFWRYFTVDETYTIKIDEPFF